MKNLVAKFRKQMEIIITLLVIFAGIGYYYAVYIPKKEQNIAQAKFRTLQSMDANIHKKLADTRLTLGVVNNYIKDPMPAGLVDCNWTKPDQPQDARLDSIKNNLFISLKKAYYFNVKKINSDALEILKLKENTMRLQGDSAERLILIDAPFTANTDSSFLSTVGYKFSDFIEPLLRKESFDKYVVFEKGSVIYEDLPTGLSYEKLDTFLNARNGILSSTVRIVSIGNLDYRMFLHPVSINQSHELIIGGLIKFDKWDKARKALPVSFLITLLFILAGLMLLIPFGKLFLMRNTERINLNDILGAYISLILLAVFCTFMTCFWIFDDIYFGDKTKYSLNKLSGKILDAYTEELKSAKNKLDMVSADSIITSYKAALQNCLSSNNKKFCDTIDHAAAEGEWDKIKNTGFISFARVFWANANGIQFCHFDKIKNKQFDLAGNPSERDYFIGIKNNTFNFEDSAYVDQVISSIDNNFKTIIAKKDPSTGGVIAITCPLKSVGSPVLPYGFGFAIINENGDVLYHSDSTRNLNEKFIEECNSPDDLIAGIAAKTSVDFTANYYGNNFLMHLQPVPRKGLNYFIVTFFNTDLESAVNTSTISLTFITIAIFTLFQLTLLTGFLILKYISRKRYSLYSFAKGLTNWLFIQQYEIKSKSIVLIGAAISIASLLIIFTFNSLLLTSIVLILLAAATITIVFKIKINPNKNDVNYDSLTKRTVLLLLLKVTAIAILPVICFYLIAFDYNMDLLSRFELNDFNLSINKIKGIKPAEHIGNTSNYIFYTDENYINECNYGNCEIAINKPVNFAAGFPYSLNALSYTPLSGQIKNFTGKEKNVDGIFFGKSLSRVIIDDNGNRLYSSMLSRLTPVIDTNGLIFIILCIVFILLFTACLLWKGINSIFGFPAIKKLKGKFKYSNDSKKIDAGNRRNAKFVLIKDSESPAAVLPASSPWFFIDFSDIPDSSDAKNQLNPYISQIASGGIKQVAVLNFHYNMKDMMVNRCKLNTLERLLRTDEKGNPALQELIVFSEIEPRDFLDRFYCRPVFSETDKSITDEDYFRWSMVLGAFSYFPTLAAITDKNYSGITNKSDDINYYRYYRLWQLLSMEERILLVDLAEEGFINTKNRNALELLLEKDIIKIDQGRFWFGDSGFEKHVQGLSESEKIRITKLIKDETSWRDFKYPIFISIAGILWFIFYSNPSSFGYLLPILTGLATGIPTLLKAITPLLSSDKKAG